MFIEIIGIRCPTCGMTRALLSLFSGDLKSYADYNIMALPVATAVIAELFNEHITDKKVLHFFSSIIFTINFIYYVHRIIL